ncbi:MAG: hypothetical protein M2R45_04257 [Verrucomicrobia subdivision 3 bacterium]|nr:hypothetical protein [Limisphaerales bacterium]MCS1412616.1 hypothetical protein [Limisphaerales bacterium]
MPKFQPKKSPEIAVPTLSAQKWTHVQTFVASTVGNRRRQPPQRRRVVRVRTRHEVGSETRELGVRIELMSPSLSPKMTKLASQWDGSPAKPSVWARLSI